VFSFKFSEGWSWFWPEFGGKILTRREDALPIGDERGLLFEEIGRH
jgi:hypothetical protein